MFLLADEEASWVANSKFGLQGGTVQPVNTYSCILKVTGQVWESQKRISINTDHSYHPSINLSKPVATDLTIKSDSILTKHMQPNRKR